MHINVWAEVLEGCLKISGQDFGVAVEEALGDNEYKYFYDFDRKNTDHLFRLLAPEGQDVRNVLKRRFSGMDGCQALREFCEGNGIKYGFFYC